MYKISVVIFQRLLLVVGFALLAACGGGSGGGSSTASTKQVSQPQLFIAGAGIKGPLAFASVELFALDTRFGELYEPGYPIAAAATDAYAQIAGLAVPVDIAPPYVLVIDGTNAIDLNTGMAPVIRKMVTVITQESLNSGKPVYATPYTTLAYQMLKLRSVGIGSQGSSFNDLSIGNHLVHFNQDILQAIGFRMRAETDIFTTPPIITADSTSIEEQQMVINYRAAIEALSSLLYKLSLSSEPFMATDSLLVLLALDLLSDGIIDNSASGLTIGGIDTAVLSQNPMSLDIPNTSYQVRDIVHIMDEERGFVGNSSNIEFLIDDIGVTLEPALLSSQLDYAQETDYTGSVGNITSTLLLAGLINSTPVVAGDIFNLNFNNHDLHIYSDSDVRNDWDSNGNITLDSGAMEISNDPDPSGTHGKVLRVNYEGGNFGYRGISGGQWWKIIDDYEEIYYSFDVYFEPGFDFVKSGKLPSPRSTGYRKNGKAGVQPDGTDFWTAGLSWGVGGELRSYVYHANQNTRSGFGRHISWNDGADKKDTYFIPGRWHQVEIRVKLNTPGVLDGRLEGWFDGEKRLDTSSIMFRMPGGESLNIGTLFFYTFFGGGDSSFSATKDEQVYFDNFVLSTKPITH